MVKESDVFIRYSPNHNERPALPTELLVLHYTGMKDAITALEWLCNADSQVSAHYLVDEEGEIYLLVEEDRRAWHAGVSAWKEWTNINDISIGIEIVNPGHEYGYREFPQKQMDAVLRLSKDIMERHEIALNGVVAHSDIAPTRKQDPGELFPWQWLASHGVGTWHDIAPFAPDEVQPCDVTLEDLHALRHIGYVLDEQDGGEITAVITAFQRRYRPHNITGLWDNECSACLQALL